MSDWIEWKGGKCPVLVGTMVRVQLRNEAREDAERDEPCGADAYGFSWLHAGDASDIIAYQIVEPAPAEAEVETLRDKIAETILPTIIATCINDTGRRNYPSYAAYCAMCAYEMADAMLAARSRAALSKAEGHGRG